MDINDLFDGIMKSINQFAEGRSRTSCASRHSNVPVHQIAEQRLQEKMQKSGPGPENGRGKNAENFEAKEKRDMTDLCPADAVASLRDSPEGSRSACSR
ncbi:MAG: hypothetical protein OEV91_09440, partial [Desulfobulbaceae bacterium]|nr:hypothetical protein [Desulfobulbaceae bacterium]